MPAGRAGGVYAPASEPASVVYYPKHPAPGRVVALAAITGAAEPGKPPGAIRRILTGETEQPVLESGLVRPVSLAVRGGQILVVDAGRGAIVQIDPASSRMRLLEVRGLSGPVQPVALASDDKGRLYIGDAKAGAVLEVGSDNVVVRSLRLDTGAAFVPVDLAVSADRLYAVNRAGRRVDVFDLASGQRVGEIQAGEAGAPALPVAVSLDSKGQIYVVDMVGARVRVYTPGGKLVRELGRPGNRPGLFAQPRSVAVGPDGITYVADVATQVVQMFNPSSQLLTYFGGAGDAAGEMGMPAKIVTDRTLLEAFAARMPAGFVPQYLVLVANQAAPGRIGVYAFGQVSEAGEESAGS